MEFMQSGRDIVRSDRQRRLLDHWASLRGAGPLPIWHGLNADAFPVPVDSLAVTEVAGIDSAARFRVAFHGQRLIEAFAGLDCVGRFLDEILPPPYLASALATYQQVVGGRMPVYTVSDMRDPAGRIVHQEQLLLPFSIDGDEVERVLASIEAVSPEGPFELRRLMSSPIRAPVIALCATIQY